MRTRARILSWNWRETVITCLRNPGPAQHLLQQLSVHRVIIDFCKSTKKHIIKRSEPPVPPEDVVGFAEGA